MLIINPWRSIKRIGIMLHYAAMVSNIDLYNVALYYIYTSDFDDEKLKQKFLGNPTMTYYDPGITPHDTVILRNRNIIARMNFDSRYYDGKGVNRIEEILQFKNWKTFQDIYPDPLFNHFKMGNVDFTGTEAQSLCWSMFDEPESANELLPIIADAIEEVAQSDSDEYLLDHCRVNFKHTPYCWVMRRLKTYVGLSADSLQDS